MVKIKKPDKQCRTCFKLILNRRFKYHEKLCSQEPIGCVVCGKMMKSNSLERHIRTMHKNRSIDLCGKQPFDLFYCENLVNGIKCGKVFKHPASLSKHRLTHLPDSSKFRCYIPSCSKLFSSLWHVKRHMLQSERHSLKEIHE